MKDHDSGTKKNDVHKDVPLWVADKDFASDDAQDLVLLGNYELTFALRISRQDNS